MDGSEQETLSGDPNSSGMVLLPPNYFVVPTPRSSSHDPLWTRTALQEEVERLRTELAEIKEQQAGPSQESEHLASDSGGNVSLLNKVLAQQTAELSRLRAETDRQRTQHIREVANLQAEVENLQRRAIENEESCQSRVKEVTGDYEQRLRDEVQHTSEIIRRHEAEKTSWDNQMMEYKSEVKRMLEEKDSINLNLTRSHEALQERFRSAEAELLCVHEQVKSLKVCESWAAERIDVLRQKEDVENRLRSSESANELKQQRLDTLQKILVLQENELGKYGPSNNQKAMTALLCRWREKVFALMVQAESEKLSHAKEIQTLRSANEEVEQMLDHVRCVATTNELKLKACQAEVQNEREEKQLIQSQLDVTRQAHEETTIQRDALSSSLLALRRTVESVAHRVSSNERELESKAMTTFHAMERRIARISERVPVVKAQLTRLQAKEDLKNLRDDFESRVRDLRRELEIVRGDRDRLARQMECDAGDAEDKVRQLREKYDTDITELQRKCDSLQTELEMKSQLLDSAESNVADLQACLASVEEENEKLKTNLASIERSQDEAIRCTTAQLYEEHSHQMAQIRNTLDEVRREHASSVIALRQAERDLERAQSEHSKDMIALREQTERRVSDLQNKVASLESERNLLRATIRQEGLLRAPTEGAVVDSRASSKEQPRSFEGAEDGQKKVTAEFSPHLANLIEEVRSLVRSVEATGDVEVSDDEDL